MTHFDFALLICFVPMPVSILGIKIGKLSKLERLRIMGNHLSNLPKSLTRCSALRELWIGQNPFLSALPGTFHKLTSLVSLIADGNPNMVNECSACPGKTTSPIIAPSLDSELTGLTPLRADDGIIGVSECGNPAARRQIRVGVEPQSRWSQRLRASAKHGLGPPEPLASALRAARLLRSRSACVL